MLFKVPHTPARPGNLVPGISRKLALAMARDHYINKLASHQCAVKKPKAINRPPVPTYESALRTIIMSFRENATRIAPPAPAPLDPKSELYELDMKDCWSPDDYARSAELKSQLKMGALA